MSELTQEEFDALWNRQVAVAVDLCRRMVQSASENGTWQKTLVYSYFSRVTVLAMSTVGAYNSGAYIAAKVVLRACLETVFYLCALVLKPEFLDQLRPDVQKRQRQHIENYLKFARGKLTPEVTASLDQLVASLTEFTKTIGPKKAAEDAGLLALYYTQYSELSLEACHPNAIAALAHVREEEDVLNIRLDISRKEAHSTLPWTAQCLMNSIAALARFAGMEEQLKPQYQVCKVAFEEANRRRLAS